MPATAAVTKACGDGSVCRGSSTRRWHSRCTQRSCSASLASNTRLVAAHLQDGSLVELVPQTALDVPLYWQHARVASALLDGLSRVIQDAAARALLPV